MLASGMRIDRYELVSPLHEGPGSEVWLAKRDDALFSFKAIRLRDTDGAPTRPGVRTLFLEETRVAQAIEHPRIARIVDRGEAGDVLYFVSEYVDGDSLDNLLGDDRVPPAVAARIAADVCAALHAAHRHVDQNGQLRCVLHRDVSPRTVLVSRYGEVKLTGFGVGSARDKSGGDAPSPKLHYLAPEQALGQPLSATTDIFSVGATLYRMLAGKPPFIEKGDPATLRRLVSGDPPPVLDASVPEALRAIVDRALAHESPYRYPTALSMQTALEEVLADLPPQSVASWVLPRLGRGTAVMPGRPIPSLAADAMPRPKPPPPPSRPQTVTAPMAAAPPPPETRSTSDDGPAAPFMDVHALVNQARPLDSEVPPPAPARDPQRPEAQDAMVPRPATPQLRPRIQGARHWTRLAFLGVAGVLVLTALILLLPSFLRSRAIAMAQAQGVALTVDRVGIGFGGFALRQVDAKVPSLPGLDVKADEVFVSLRGDVRLRSLEITLDGKASELGQDAVIYLLAHRAVIAGSGDAGRHVSIVSANVTWQRPFGEGSKATATDVGLEIDSRGAGTEEVRASVGRGELVTPKTTLGPWSGSYERTSSSSRVRVLFDPYVPDGPSVLWIAGANVAERLTVHIPRTPFARLGVRPDDLGLPFDGATELAVDFESGPTSASRFEAHGKADIAAARLHGMKGTFDVHVEGGAVGPVGKPLDLDHTFFSAGPFVVSLTGTVTPKTRGFRLDSLFKSNGVACDKLARAEAKNLGPVATTLQEILAKTGAAKVTGTASASGAFRYDTDDPDEFSLEIATRDTCGLSLLGF